MAAVAMSAAPQEDFLYTFAKPLPAKSDSTSAYAKVSDNLTVHPAIQAVVEKQVLPGLQSNLKIDSKKFWGSFEKLLDQFYDENIELLNFRDALQEKIEACPDAVPSKEFLESIGYLVKDQGPLQLSVQNVDPEIAKTNAPQLVVPLDNARYALNAANARWGSLFDALYGTDAFLDVTKGGKGYDAERGLKVFAEAFKYLDSFIPINGLSWADVTSIEISSGVSTTKKDDVVFMSSKSNGGNTKYLLKDTEQFIGSNASEYYFKQNGLHIVLKIKPDSPSGQQSPFGLADIVLEAAVTTIMDCESA